MDTLDKLNEMLEKELTEIVKKGAITPDQLVAVDKVVDIMKDIKEICNMDDHGYSQRGYSYDNWDGSRGSNRVRYNRGNYTRGNSNRGYSRHDEREEILDRLDYLMENSGTEQERQAIRQALNTLENM